jgi:hypothetical protein
MFDQVVSPICLYGSEIWCLDNLDIKNKKFKGPWGLQEFVHDMPIEQLNSSFCKYVLGVNRKTGNIAAKSQLGRFASWHKSHLGQCVNFYKHISDMPSENSLLFSALSMSERLAAEGCSSWFSCFDTLCKKADIDPKNCTLEEIKLKLKVGYIQYWSENVLKKYKDGSGGKYNTYVKFKTKFMYEPYLNQIHKFKHWVSFDKAKVE